MAIDTHWYTLASLPNVEASWPFNILLLKLHLFCENLLQLWKREGAKKNFRTYPALACSIDLSQYSQGFIECAIKKLHSCNDVSLVKVLVKSDWYPWKKPQHFKKKVLDSGRNERGKKYTWLEQWQTLWRGSSDFEWKVGFWMYPLVLSYVLVYIIAHKLLSKYPDKELLFSSECYDSFLSYFTLWRGRGL